MGCAENVKLMLLIVDSQSILSTSTSAMKKEKVTTCSVKFYLAFCNVS